MNKSVCGNNKLITLFHLTISVGGINTISFSCNKNFLPAIKLIGFFIKSNLQKIIGLYNLNYKCSSDYDLFYKLFNNNNLIGASTTKDELIGIVESGGFSSKYGFWNRLKEEMQIRKDNNQNLFLIYIIYLNAIFKYYMKKIL